MGKYELSLTANYVPDWTIVEATREFFQNAIDQANTEPDNDMFYDYDEEAQILSIGNKRSMLTARTLLLGATTKADDDKTIGKFGEGYKIATLVAIREGHNVVFYNYGAKEVWRPRFVKSRRYKENILTFFTESFTWSKPPNHDLTITIDNVTPENYKHIVDSNLIMHDDLGKTHETDLGTILCDEKYQGKVYVNGLYVGTHDYMHCGYNLNADQVKLDRDRRLIDSFDLKWQSARMWIKCESDEIIALANENAPDVEYVGSLSAYLTTTVTEQAHSAFREEHGDNAVPVCNQREMVAITEEYVDVKPVIVSETQHRLVTSAPTYKVDAEQKEVITTKVRLNAWFDSIRHKLTDEEAMEYYDISSELE